MVCGDAASVEEALTGIQDLKPDLVIVDLSLSGSPGLDLIKTLKSQYASLPVLVVSHARGIPLCRARPACGRVGAM